jgi:hypothetical protein
MAPLADWTSSELVIVSAYGDALLLKGNGESVDVEPAYAAFLKILNAKLTVPLHKGIYFLNKYLSSNPEALPDDFSEVNTQLDSYITSLTNDDFVAARSYNQYMTEKLSSEMFLQPPYPCTTLTELGVPSESDALFLFDVGVRLILLVRLLFSSQEKLKPSRIVSLFGKRIIQFALDKKLNAQFQFVVFL